ncbi:hypothetical protein [Conexibacter woesei]|uniref:hypothetical protein n=1 Tax=Conexibacter woesei TaxID=191495 RepID=UPI00042286FA|nr:hypothetical protein [Conexibacter woesei]
MIYWSQLQPDPSRPADLGIATDGCARGAQPCGPFGGIRDELAAIASEQKAGFGVPRVEVVIAGVPAWAAQPASGCERSDAGPSSRPITAQGLDAYKALIAQVAGLAGQEGAALNYWSPWNEPNHPAFISPQRAKCDRSSPTLAAGVYAQLVRAARDALATIPGPHQLVLGEMAGTTVPSPRRSTVQEMVAALPDDVACASRLWTQHDYAQVTPDPAKPDPVLALEQALDARPCTQGAHIWVTETGVGGGDPGAPRATDDASLRAQCRAQDAKLRQWAADPRVDAAFQYTFREDSAYPVGLADAGLTRTYPTYDLWAAWGARRPNDGPPPLPASCAEPGAASTAAPPPSGTVSPPAPTSAPPSNATPPTESTTAVPAATTAVPAG